MTERAEHTKYWTVGSDPHFCLSTAPRSEILTQSHGAQATVSRYISPKDGNPLDPGGTVSLQAESHVGPVPGFYGSCSKITRFPTSS